MLKVRRACRVVSRNGTSVRLSKTEYRLIEALGALGRGQLIPRDVLIQGTWGHQQIISADTSNLICVISKLKKKVGVDFIRSRRGYGYYLTQDIRFVD